MRHIDEEPEQCPKCEVYHFNKDQHICVTYDGPPCITCGNPTTFVWVAAPGYGSGHRCKNNHYHGTYGLMEPEECV